MHGSNWRCPKCFAGYQTHGEGPCKYKRLPAQAIECEGLICKCGSDPHNVRTHGMPSSPCRKAHCHHCGWTGQFPVPLPKAPKVERDAKHLGCRRQERRLKENLTNLVKTAYQAIRALDLEMKQPSSVERGQHVGRICNALDMATDAAAHFGLGVALDKLKALGK